MTAKPVVLTEAKSFLEKFNYQNITYQLLKHGKPLKTFSGGIEKLDLKAVQNLSDSKTEFFFMVNEGDGVTHEPHKTCRSQASVTTLKALFIDTDTCPFENVKTYLKKVGIKPHFVIETSPSRYHIYFLLHDLPATKKALDEWKACQLSLVYLGDKDRKETGCDLSMRDHSRILRIPGFYNHKRNSHLVTTKLSLDHERYHLSELFEALSGHNFLESLDNKTTSKPYTISQTKVSEGYRHPEMTSFIAHLLNKNVSEDIVKLAFYKYAEQTFDNYADFLPDGKRHTEVLNFIEYKKSQLAQEESKNSFESAQKIISGQDDFKDPFDLEDSFYFEAPGLVGAITKEICAKARYPIPSFAFGAALASVGTIKAKHVVSSLGHAASNYFLLLSGTGSGKNYAQEVMSHTFSKLGLGSLLSFGIRSEKGIARFLEINESIGVLSLDEAETFLTSLSDNHTPHYLKACKSLLLELYTSTNMPHKSLGQLGDKKQAPIVLRYPRLNLLAYGVLHTLTESFNKKSISDGLLQRFLVLTNYRAIKRNENYKPASVLSETFNDLSYLANRYKFNLEKDYITYLNMEAELNSEPDQQKREKLEEKLNALKAAQVSNVVKKINFTPKALELYNSYTDSLDNKRNQELRTLSGLEGIYTRGAEQVGRLATAIAINEIDHTLVDYCITFVDSRINALKHYVIENYSGNTLKQKADTLLKAAARIMQKSGKGYVTKRELYHATTFSSSFELDNLLKFLVDTGELDTKLSDNLKGPKSNVFIFRDVI